MKVVKFLYVKDFIYTDDLLIPTVIVICMASKYTINYFE